MHRVGVGDNHRIPKEQKYDAMNLCPPPTGTALQA